MIGMEKLCAPNSAHNFPTLGDPRYFYIDLQGRQPYLMLTAVCILAAAAAQTAVGSPRYLIINISVYLLLALPLTPRAPNADFVIAGNSICGRLNIVECCIYTPPRHGNILRTRIAS